jgi:hypothetical protein
VNDAVVPFAGIVTLNGETVASDVWVLASAMVIGHGARVPELGH